MARHVDIDRTREVLDAIDDGMEAYIQAVYEETVKQIQMMMDAGRDATGKPFAPNAPSTVRAKGHSTPLIESGDLRDSVGKDSELRKRELTAIFASDVEYAGVHEFGAPEMGIPPRPFLQPGLAYAASISDDRWNEEVDRRVQANLL